MIGRKKLGAIRAELRQEIAKSGAEPGRILDRLIKEAKGKPTADEREIDNLRMLRDALERSAGPARKKGRPIART